MRWQEFIDQNPEVMVGKPVIRGTRITAELILERLGNGATDADILEAYPHLRVEQIRAVQAFAAAAIGSEELIFSTSHK
jgi:uncharacterized protein (DUF433 family)